MTPVEHFRSNLSELIIELQTATFQHLHHQHELLSNYKLLQQLFDYHMDRFVESGTILVKIVEMCENEDLDETKIEALAQWS